MMVEQAYAQRSDLTITIQDLDQTVSKQYSLKDAHFLMVTTTKENVTSKDEGMVVVFA